MGMKVTTHVEHAITWDVEDRPIVTFTAADYTQRAVDNAIFGITGSWAIARAEIEEYDDCNNSVSLYGYPLNKDGTVSKRRQYANLIYGEPWTDWAIEQFKAAGVKLLLQGGE
jgi:hypothetical protein